MRQACITSPAARPGNSLRLAVEAPVPAPFFCFFSQSRGTGCNREEAPRPGFGLTPRPVARGSLFARSGPLRGPARRSAPGARVDARHAAQAIQALPALTRAQNIHVLLVAIPSRQGAAHCD